MSENHSFKNGNVIFEDYSLNVKTALLNCAKQFLEEAGEEILSITIRNTKRKTGQTAGSWKKVVDEGGMCVHIGSDYWNAIYEEFGTGEFALKGDGRKGYWVFVDTGGQPSAPKGGKTYTLDEAKKVVAIMRKKGLNAYYTKGKQARRPFFNAYSASKSKIIKRAEQIFGGLN